MKYTITNLEDMPDDLPPGTYDCRIVEATLDEIKVRFIGTAYDPKDPQSLIQITKEATSEG